MMVFMGMFGWTATTEADDFSPWKYASDVNLNTTGLGVSGDVAGFPVLIRLSGTTFTPSIFSQANSDGSDIRFSKSDHVTALPYQIERWDFANSVAEIWVKVDVTGATNGGQTQIRMYWGNSGATSQSNGANVFNNGYLGAYHLNETGSNTPNGYADATGVYSATGYNMVSGDQVAGQIAFGQNFGDGYHGKYLSIFGGTTGTGCQVNVTAVDANGAITTINTTPVSGGTGYAVGDYLLVGNSANGGQGNNGVVKVTAVSGTAASTLAFVTCPHQGGSGGGGNVATVNITAPTGAITAATVANYGVAYNVGDTLLVAGGNGDGKLLVATTNTTNGGQWGFGAKTVTILSGGSGYTTANGVSTTDKNWYTTGTKATTKLGPGLTFASAPNFTFSAWAWSSGTADADVLFSLTKATNGNCIKLKRHDANNLTVAFTTNGAETYTTSNNFPNPSSSWVHVGFTVTNTGTCAVYINGTPQAITTTPTAISTGSYYFNYLGSDYYMNPCQLFQGKFNEAEISNVARSADWMMLAYQSQKTGASWFSFTPIASSAPTIVTQPTNQTVSVGSVASFSVVANGGGLSYQWQRSNDGGSTWNNVSGGAGGTTANYTLTTVAGDNGAQFRCYVSNSYGNVTSNAATLTVTCTNPSISGNPQNTTVNAGQTATFTVTASGSNLSYQWQRNTGTWTNVGTNSASYGFTTAYPADNGAQFRCVVSGACGSPVTSGTATLTVQCPLATITAQPTNQSASGGNPVTFSITASGSVTYQWLRSDNSGGSWYTPSGTTTNSSYTFTTAYPADNGSWYECNVTNSCGTVTSNHATLTVSPACVPPSISAGPVTQTIPAGDNVTFSVTATGDGLVYQWQYSTDNGTTWNPWTIGTGYTTATLTFATSDVVNGYYFRCQITGTCGNATSGSAVLNVCDPPFVSQDPQNQSVLAGQNASFTISAAGPNISYQWFCDSGSGIFHPISGQTGTILSFTASQSQDGYQYLCMVSNSCDFVNSNEATLSVCTPTAITSQPSNVNVTAGQPASFTVAAIGSGTLTYQWQYSLNGGGTWGNVPSGGTAATYSFTTSSSDNGSLYKCLVSNGCATPAVSNNATLTVCTPPSLASQPVNWSGVAGNTASFSITVPGNVTSPSYQWQKSTNGGSSWSNVTLGTGGNTPSYSFTTQGSDNGSQYHCVVTNSCGTATSNAALATVCVPASITGNPSNQNVIDGGGATFTVTAAGGGTIYYQWQQSTDGGNTWSIIGGATSASYAFTANIGENGYQYRCGALVNGCGGTAYSAAAALSVCIPPAITANPSNQSVNAGSTASFSAAASGSGTISYQWQQSADGGSTWNPIGGATSATYGFTAAANQDQYRFRCQASNGCGSAALSAAAVLTVCSQAAVSVGPSPQSVTAGANATFSITATGTPLISYQWQVSTDNGSTWNNVTSGGLAATYTFTTATGENGWQYRCAVSTGCFTTAYSPAALLTVCTPPSITQQPVSQPGKQVGDQVTFTVTVPAEVTAPVNYQWQKSTDGGTTWPPAPGASTSSSYTFTVASGDGTAQFRCYITNGCGQIYSNAVNIGVCTAVSITSNPSAQNVTAGNAATFTVAATGVPAPSYQWQVSVDNQATWNNVALNGTSAAYTFTTASTDNGSYFRCNVTNGCGSPATSASALLTVCTPPSISQQPTNPGTVIAGSPITLTVAVPVVVTSPSFQWQRSLDTGKTWNNVATGGAAASYNFTSASTDNGVQVRCMVSNSCGTVYSSVITLAVCTPVAIAGNPGNQSVTAGQNATFTVTATGSGTLLYQWDYSANGGATWSNVLSGGTAASLVVATTSNLDGYKYRCNVSNGCGSPAVSAAASLSVCTPPSIATQPVPPPLKNVGDPVTISVTVPAQVTSPAYQWQRSGDNGATWQSASGASATTATYTFTAAAGDFGAQYRCVVSNGCGTATSNAVTLSVCTQAAVTVPPAPQSVTAGQNATFTVTATGTPSVSYQWQYSADTGKTWTNVAVGGTAASYTFTSATANNAWQYRAAVSTGCGTVVYSAAALLSVCTPPSVLQPPASQTDMIGQSVTFGVVVPPEVTSPAYQWQRSPDGNTWTNATGATAATASYTFTVAAGDDGARFRCVVTNGCGTVNSAAATLTICTPASITMAPVDQSTVAGQNVTFSVAAAGSAPLSYQWQTSPDSITWSPVSSGGTAASYTFASATSEDLSYFRCVVSGNCGTPAVSPGGRLHVCTPPHVVSQPGNQDKNLGDTAVFGVTCTGSSLAYQWQRSPTGTTWTNATAGTGAATAMYRLVSTAGDDSARFRCMVTNGCGRDSSAAAMLLVCSPPSIAAQPKDTSVVTGGTATFRVGFVGTLPQYQWQKSSDGLVWNDTAGATAAAFAFTAKATDNGLRFRCYIKSKCGDVISNPAVLTVCDPAAITAQTVANDTLISGATVVFGVTATGTSRTYQWQRRGAADTGFMAIPAAAAATYAFVAQTPDSGARYRCLVSASCGAPAVSAVALLTVYGRVHAAFGAVPAAGQVPLSVSFYDSSSGNFSTRAWDFGDSTVDTVSKNPAHSFTRAGTYTVRLAVTGVGGTDTASLSVFAYNPGGNPIQMTGAYVTPQKIRVTLTGYNAIAPPSPSVSADSVGLWYTVASWPQTRGQSTFIKYYTPAALRAGGATFTDVIDVPALTGKDSVYGIMSDILWSDRKTTPFDSGNGALVLMRDTMPIADSLLISGVYIPDDTARIYLDNAAGIDTSRVDSVGVWYSLATDTVNFKDQAFTKWFAAADVVKAGSRYVYSIVNSQFNNEQKTMYAAVELHGKNGRYSPPLSTSFTVGKQRPHNPIHLAAHALSATRIRLTWNNLAAYGIERMIIWYRTGSPVPLSVDVTSLHLDSLVPGVSDTVIIGNKFSEDTRYFFGAQVFKGGLWSAITDSSSATDSTLKAGDTLPYNSVQVKSLVFDTSVNQLRVCWSVNMAQAESLQVGILYSTDGPPTVNTGQQQAIDVRAAGDCAYVAVQGNILFNHTYYVGLWLRRSDGAWTRPSAAGYDSVRTPSYTWQNVVYFTKQNDTVFAFNNSVRLLNTPGDSSVTHNTLYYVPLDTAALAGFVQAGVGFTFKNKDGGVPFYIGIRVDTIPPGYSLADVRIFHRTDAGAWLVDGSPLAVDTAGRYVYVLTNKLDLPFVALIDTTHPKLSVNAGAWDPVPAQHPFADTIVVRDHLSNVSWHFYAAKGGSSLFTSDTAQLGTLSDTLDTIIVSVDGQYASVDNGARAVVYVFDGTHRDSVDLSRSVILDTAGIVRTAAQDWTPLSTTMVLDTQDVKRILRPLSSKSPWKYDPKQFRLFRWMPGPANAASASKWTEYSDSGAATFALARGSLLWLKTRDMAALPLGRGVTPPLTKPFAVRLGPKTFTDVALPFNFDVTLGDIFAATGALPVAPDSLQFYSWHKNAAGRYWTDAKFIAGIDSLNNRAATLAGGAGFSVFNPSADTLMLVVPPLPQAMSNIGLSKKRQTTGGWALRVVPVLSDGTPLTSLYCGFAPARDGGVSWYPTAPSLVKAYAAVYDPAAGQTHGNAVVHAMPDGGAAYLLVFGNETDQRAAISYKVENVKTLPQGMKARLYNPAADSAADASSAGATVAVDAGGREYRWLFAGTDAYLAKVRTIARPGVLRFMGTYPNPFRSFVRIRYSLPYDGVDKVKFVIYDLRGRAVWKTQITPGFMTGSSELLWNAQASDGRPAAAGVYIVSMSALAKTGRQLGVFNGKMTLIK